ncbi:MAG: TRAFs-binding domain-containing protein [Bacteroidota bacterium]
MSSTISQIERLIEQGRYFEARSGTESLLTGSNDLRTKQLYALALSKAGVPEAALAFMEPVYAAFPDDPESAGIMGSIYKELFKKNQSNPFAIKSRDTYLKNFAATKNYYTGINAATMSAMAGQSAKGREIATEVISLIEGKSEDFWVLATLGEAYLLTKNKANAVQYYVRARKAAGSDWGKVTSVHNQLWLLNHYITVPNDVMRLFLPPGVVSFVGHMIDDPQRKEARFPAAIEQKIKDAIVQQVRSLDVHIGYTSLACGGDILFAEAMAEEGREVNIFLPFAKSDFIKTSVQFAGEGWVNRFNALIEKFPVSYLSTDPFGGLDDIFTLQTKVIFGSAAMRSHSNRDSPKLLTVMSAVDLKRIEGGTRDTLGLWPFPKNHTNINPDLFITDRSVVIDASATTNELPQPAIKQPVRYLVNCDLSGSLSGSLEKVLEYRKDDTNDRRPTLIADSASSTVLASFTNETESIEFVRFVIAALKSVANKGSFRISLHCGPVNISEAGKISGKTVSRAVEMIKVAPSNSIIATEQFAACLALSSSMFSVEYGGVFQSTAEENFSVYNVALK